MPKIIISCSLETRKHNLANYPSNNHSTKHHISVRLTNVLITIPKQTKTLFKIPTTLQGFAQTHLRPTVKQPLDYKSPMPPEIFASVSNQQRQLTQNLSTYPKNIVSLNQQLFLIVFFSETNRYAMRRKSFV